MKQMIQYYKLESSGKDFSFFVDGAIRAAFFQYDSENKGEEKISEKGEYRLENKIVQPMDSEIVRDFPEEKKKIVSLDKEVSNSGLSILKQDVVNEYKGFFGKKLIKTTIDLILKGTSPQINRFTEYFYQTNSPIQRIVEMRELQKGSISFVTEEYGEGENKLLAFNDLLKSSLLQTNPDLKLNFKVYVSDNRYVTKYFSCSGVCNGTVEDILQIKERIMTSALGVKMNKVEVLFT